MTQIALPESKIHPAAPSADPNDVPTRKRASFAAGIAASEFGRNRPHPDSDSFVDRRPGEVAILRAVGRLGANR